MEIGHETDVVIAAARCIFTLKAYLGEIINHISAKSDRFIIYVRI